MPQESNEVITPQISTKTFVRGALLFSTQDGSGYEERNRNRVEDQIVIEDKGNLGGLKRQIQSKRQEITKRKQKSKKQKQMLIPIRDTPVEPLPEPTMDNNKCQRATQQQFEYFQTYISQKQKQKKFQEQQNRKIQLFQKQQQRYRHNEQKQERKNISIVFEKEDPINSGLMKNVLKKKGPTIKVVIKKKGQPQNSQSNQSKRQGIKENDEKQKSISKVQKINKVIRDQKNKEDEKLSIKNNENENQQDDEQEKRNINQEEEFEKQTKVRLIQQNYQ